MLAYCKKLIQSLSSLIVRNFYLFIVVEFCLVLFCTKQSPTTWGTRVPVDESYSLDAHVCCWKYDRKAAYSIGFDDARQSHYTIAGPELYKRSMTGTFYIQTSALNIYTAHFWRTLILQGHEIASHTRSHVNCTELSEDQLRYELCASKYDIEFYLFPKEGIPSFCYPCGKLNPFTTKIASEYYLSCRGRSYISRWAINPDTTSISDLGSIKGFGVYTPFDGDRLRDVIQETINVNGWILPYFHTITIDAPITADQVSIDDFLCHLDYVQSLRDSLWIATHGRVAKYIAMRCSAILQTKVMEDRIQVGVTCDANMRSNLDSLSISISLPDNWDGYGTIAISPREGKYHLFKHTERRLVLQVLPGDKMEIFATTGNK